MTPEEHAQCLVKIIDSGRNSGWSTIDTAPKDGTEILVVDGNKIRIATFDASYGDDGMWLKVPGLYSFPEPKFWMALPEPPKEGV